MERHLNLFYSYSGGNESDVGHTKVLEDNVTRAFMVTLSQLDSAQKSTFLLKLFGNHGVSKIGNNVRLDLQNVDSEYSSSIHSSPIRIVLMISRTLSKITKEDIGRVSKQRLSWIEKLPKDGLKKMQQHYKKNAKGIGDKPPFALLRGHEIPYEQLLSFYELCHGARPDAWIYELGSYTVLIEAKVGNATQSIVQILRHLKDQHGLKITSSQLDKGEYCLIPITWEQLANMLIEVAPRNVFINELRRYLVMSGQILDLGFIVSRDEGYSKETMREQFPLFMRRLDKSIESVLVDKKSSGLLRRDKRPLHNLWDWYGVYNEEKKKTMRSPHISVSFDEKYASIDLTIRPKQKMVKKLLKSEKFRDYLKNIIKNDVIDLDRYCFYLDNHHLLDHRKGQIKGEVRPAFQFTATLRELCKDENKYNQFLDETLPQMIPFSKQFGFGIRVQYFDPSRRTTKDGLKARNVQLLKDVDELLKLYSNFVGDMIPLMKELI